ncbi:MAG: hypothetical protein IKE23_07060 [Exiguobacterium sp.]|nr:hypothetical protein [Exiguobacterium sp.]
MPCFVLAICFWVLAAIAIILFAAWVYVEVQYYHWNKIDRENEQIVQYLVKQIEEKFEELQNELSDSI